MYKLYNKSINKSINKYKNLFLNKKNINQDEDNKFKEFEEEEYHPFDIQYQQRTLGY